MTEIVIEPQKMKIGGVEWTLAEAEQLRSLFEGRQVHAFDKRMIRSTPLIQKAMSSEVAVQIGALAGASATLQLSKVGNDLIGLLAAKT